MKLLASDFDGTLLLHPRQDENIILEEDKKQSNSFKRQEIFLVCVLEEAWMESLNGVRM